MKKRGILAKIITVAAAGLAVSYCALEIAAKINKPASVYANEPEQRNPLEGKKVVFVPDENDKENADGARGHLEAVGESEYKPGVYDKYIKRAVDKTLSFGGLVALSPVFAGLSLAIYLDDPGPIFFTQKRLGQNKQYFKLHKFRSMKMCTPHDVPTHMLENPEQYITRVGKFIRAHSLDELPQIWDIFVGNMSVIGPRPGLWNQDVLTAERDKYGANDIKPGLTGWAQINGRDELEIPDKARLDGEYVQKESLMFDAKCFLGTVSKVAKDDSVVEGGTGEMAKRSPFAQESERQLQDIAGKRILFFAPAFFSYEKKIADKMREMGAEVDMYDVRSVTSAAERALLKVNPAIFSAKSERYYADILAANADKNYDYVLIVKCDMTPAGALEKMRELYPNAKLCLYLWDSIENIPGVTGKLKYFDSIKSFDPRDCEQIEGMKLRPLFFADEFRKEPKSEGFKYDLSFLGTIHSDRWAIIKEIRSQLNEQGLRGNFFMYLQSRAVYHLYKALKKEFKDTKPEDFDYEKKPLAEIAAEVDESKVILDIQHPKQTGLTMRTLEMLGMNKKLITTNESIRNYDFYDPANILIADRKNIKLDPAFMQAPYRPVSADIYEKYSLRSWILDVLD